MLWGCSPPLRPTCWARENTLLSVVRWISLYLPFTFTSIIIHFKFRGHFYFFDLNDMGNWCSKSYLPSSMMQSKQNRFWKGKGMVGPAHSRLRTVTLNNASHHHLTVQTVVWCFTSSSYSVDCCIAHCNSEQCFTSPSYSALLYDASHHHLTVQTVVWCFTSSSYSADCCMMLYIIILQCRLNSFPTLSTSLGIFPVPPRSPKAWENTTWPSASSPTVPPLSGRPKFSNRTHPFG